MEEPRGTRCFLHQSRGSRLPPNLEDQLPPGPIWRKPCIPLVEATFNVRGNGVLVVVKVWWSGGDDEGLEVDWWLGWRLVVVF
ncbi:hypothetical protein QYF36_019958 [Acer negundo]|nr:hypothetical protein QYF36_019958 [Acer negundo]